MRPRNLLILFLLVAALGGFIWFVERDLPSPEEREAEARKVLPGLVEEEVSAIAIESSTGSVRLERQATEIAPATETDAVETGEAAGDELAEPAPPPAAAGWRLTAPLSAAADRNEVEQLLAALATLEHQRTIDDPDPAELGLDDPRASITLSTGGGERALRIGSQVPTAAATLVQVAGEARAHVVADSFMTQIERPAADWRDRNLFDGERAAVRTIRIVPGALAAEGEDGAGEGGSPAGDRPGPLLLARRGESFWLEEPLVDRADRDPTDRLLGDLVGLAASGFPAPQPAAAEAGLAPPAGRFEIGFDDRVEPLVIEVGAPVAIGSLARYLRVGQGVGQGAGQGEIYESEADLARWLDRPLADWRSLAWSGLEVWEIDGVSIEEQAAEALTLERVGADWQRNGEIVAYTPVSDFLTAVTEAQGESFAPPGGDDGRGEPLLTITLVGSAGEEETLSLYPADSAGSHPATVAGREATLLLTAETVGALRDSLEQLRAAEALPLPADAEDTGELDGIAIEEETGGE